MNINAFVVDIVSLFREHDCSDIDGENFQDLMEKHGLVVRVPATEEDVKEEWAQEWGYEVGDEILAYSEEYKALRKATQ